MHFHCYQVSFGAVGKGLLEDAVGNDAILTFVRQSFCAADSFYIKRDPLEAAPSLDPSKYLLAPTLL